MCEAEQPSDVAACMVDQKSKQGQACAGGVEGVLRREASVLVPCWANSALPCDRSEAK